jgi:GT2 family glycosyltransferase
MTSSVSLKSVYIIIPAYNRKEITLSCLSNIYKIDRSEQQYHTVVVDDGSTDGTSEAIQAQYPEVQLLQGDGNLWWTGAIAKGMEYAFGQGAKCCIWLNDDCIPEINTLPLLVKLLETHPDTIVAAACYSPEFEFLVENGFRGRQRLAARPGEIVFVDGMSGYCVGIPAAVFHKIGLPDAQKFPHYDGDGMYTLQATRAGFKACILGDAKVTLPGVANPIHQFHLYAQTAPNFQSLFWSKKSPYYLPTQFSYHTKKHGLWLGFPLFIAKLLWWLGQWISLQFVPPLKPG